MKSKVLRQLVAAAVAYGLWSSAMPAEGRTTLKSICGVLGQEENTLHGLGIVVGLQGTGDGGGFLPTIRSLAIAMELMGHPIGEAGVTELKNAKNVALVTVTATVPGKGARHGDKIDCVVSSIGSAKSLAGGRLFATPLLGPVLNDDRVYAFSEGLIELDDAELTTIGRIHNGCQLVEDFSNPFVKDGRITLVLKKNYADFQVASDVAELINSQLSFQSSGALLANALDQVTIEVTVPRQYEEAPVLFVSQVLGLSMMEPETGPRVVINERAGSIVIGGDVEIGAVVVTHKSFVVETGDAAGASQFVGMATSETDPPKLKALLETLNALHVPTGDVIEIIKRIDRNGKLYADLIIE